MPVYAIPPDTRAVGTGNPPADVNQLADMTGLISLILAQYAGITANSTIPTGNAANVTVLQGVATAQAVVAGLVPSGDTTGTTDSANLAALATLSKSIPLSAGVFYIASTLNIGSTELIGPGQADCSIQPGSAFSATTPAGGMTNGAMIVLNSDNARIAGITFYGGTTTQASNPVANAVAIMARNADIGDCSFNYINGWSIEHLNQTSGASPVHQINHQPHIHDIWMQTSGGIHFNGGAPSNTPDTVGAVMANIHGNTISGGAYDALKIEDAYDFGISTWAASVGSGSTGHSIHLVGHCNAIYFDNFDIGGFPNPAFGSGQCGVKVETGPNGDTKQAAFCNGVLQTHDNAVQLQGSCSNVHFSDVYFNSSQGTGVIVNTTGTGTKFIDCAFGEQSNGAGVTAGGISYYDLDWQATGHGEIRGCEFNSQIVALNSAGIQVSVHFGAAGLLTKIYDPYFTGAGTAAGNQVVNLPQYFWMPLLSGKATLVAGTVTISTALVATTTRIQLRVVSLGGTPGALFVSAITAGTSFVISSTSGADTSVVEWELQSGG